MTKTLESDLVLPTILPLFSKKGLPASAPRTGPYHLFFHYRSKYEEDRRWANPRCGSWATLKVGRSRARFSCAFHLCSPKKAVTLQGISLYKFSSQVTNQNMQDLGPDLWCVETIVGCRSVPWCSRLALSSWPVTPAIRLPTIPLSLPSNSFPCGEVLSPKEMVLASLWWWH